MSAKSTKLASKKRRQFTDEFKRDAVQMLLDGHSAPSIAERLGLSSTTQLYRWKKAQLKVNGPVATALGYSPNLLLENFTLNGINQLWVGDITYIPLAERTFGYLAMLMDRFSRRLIGWHIDTTMTEALVIQGLRSAIAIRQPNKRLIHHTDRGGQYAGKQIRSILRRASIRQSMSRAGDCYDNAFMESCFGTIKTELEMTEYKSMQEAEKELAEYFAYYNRDRKHSGIGYQSPIQFENNQRVHSKL